MLDKKRYILKLLEIQRDYDIRSNEFNDMGVEFDSIWDLDFRAISMAMDMLGYECLENHAVPGHIEVIWDYMILDREDTLDNFLKVAIASQSSKWWDQEGIEGHLGDNNLHFACYGEHPSEK